MTSDQFERDYVFVSDLHLSLGYDPERRTYHPREDFFFDEEFFRWVRWLDAHCAEGRRWELIFVGDALDFFPVDQDTLAEYFLALDRRRETLDVTDHGQVVRYWERQFRGGVPEEQVPERIQRLIFEDDVLEGRIRLEPASTAKAAAMSLDAPPVPQWAAEMYGRYWPQVGEIAPKEAGPLVLRAPTEEEVTAFRVAWEEPPRPTALRLKQRPMPYKAARGRDEAFERRYGFLPTPEKSAEKLAAIYRGHPTFFRALAWFVGHGHRVVFLRGNHDLELYWPQVQERFREFVKREYVVAFRASIGFDVKDLVPPDFEERIIFQPGWFYYRPGAFYAEHGCQYEPLSASANPIRPLMPGNRWLLNPDIGSLGVLCFHNHLESMFPAWENEAHSVVFLLSLIRREPVRMLAMFTRYAVDFVRMAQRLWLAGQMKESDQRPSKGDFAAYASAVGLEPAMVRRIYNAGTQPLLLRRGLAWLLFSPWGHVVKVVMLLVLAGLALAGAALWYLVLAPALAGLIPNGVISATAGPALKLLTKILLWLAPPAAYGLVKRWLAKQHTEHFLYHAARRIHDELRKRDAGLRYIIHGHDHQPDTRPLSRAADGHLAYYLNTGTWTPTFAEGERRLRTLGQEVQFTFVQLVKAVSGYEAHLLRWNDDAGRAEQQLVPPADENDRY